MTGVSVDQVEAVARERFPEWDSWPPRMRMPHRDHIVSTLRAAVAAGWTPPVDKAVQ